MTELDIPSVLIVYLFGSSARDILNTTDIDLLVAYPKEIIPISKILTYRLIMSEIILQKTGLICDMVLLNFDELSQSKFDKLENAIPII